MEGRSASPDLRGSALSALCNSFRVSVTYFNVTPKWWAMTRLSFTFPSSRGRRNDMMLELLRLVCQRKSFDRCAAERRL